MDLPEVRQCQIEGHSDFGGVAVRVTAELWGIFHPRSSGRWGTEADVSGWAVATGWSA